MFLSIPSGTLPKMTPGATAIDSYANYIDALDEQRTRLHGASPGGESWSGPQARRFRFAPHRELDANLEIIASYVQPQDVLIDVGGGAGRVCLPLALRCREVINVEPSPGMAAEFTSSATEAGITNAQLVHSDWLHADGVGGDLAFTADVTYFVREIVAFLERLEAAARRRVVIALWSETPPNSGADRFRLVYGEEQAPLPGYRELLQVLWQLDILPDVRVLPGLPWWYVDPLQSRQEAVQLALMQGHWLGPSDEERARRIIDSHFGELFANDPHGYRPLWQRPIRELLITWEPDRASRP